MYQKQLPPVEELWEAFDYNPITGELLHRLPTSGRRICGERAGTTRGDGYIGLTFNNCKLMAHRVIWKWMTGKDPGEMLVDHRNRNRQDNSWTNLRLTNHSSNAINSFRVDNAKGVSYHSRDDLWCARIRTGGKRVILGYFKEREDAIAAYKAAHALRN